MLLVELFIILATVEVACSEHHLASFLTSATW